MQYPRIFLFFIALVVFSLFQCSEDDLIGDQNWLIPKNLIKKGADKDAIPALDNPDFVNANSGQLSYLNNRDKVLGLKIGESTKAYPYKMLNWHEIINDRIDTLFVSVTYAPLTGTGIAWNRNVVGPIFDFGVSGRLFNSNLIAFDRQSETQWSQMQLKGVSGPHADISLNPVHMVATTWGTWKTMYPGTQAPSSNTDFPRNYTYYPYGNYRVDNSNLKFPVEPEDNRLPLKTIVHGVVINKEAKAYPYTLFKDSVKIIEDHFQDENLVIAGNAGKDLIVVFKSRWQEGPELAFTPVQNQLPIIMEDNLGNQWDVFGKAVSGPNEGEKLIRVTNYDGYWFAWGAFYPGLEIHGEE